MLPLDDWIERDAAPFSLDSPESFDAALDRVVAPPAGSHRHAPWQSIPS